MLIINNLQRQVRVSFSAPNASQQCGAFFCWSNTFVMSSVAVDLIDEDGENVGGYYSIQVNDDGTIKRSESLESAFNKPTWE